MAIGGAAGRTTGLASRIESVSAKSESALDFCFLPLDFPARGLIPCAMDLRAGLADDGAVLPLPPLIAVRGVLLASAGAAAPGAEESSRSGSILPNDLGALLLGLGAAARVTAPTLDFFLGFGGAASSSRSSGRVFFASRAAPIGAASP